MDADSVFEIGSAEKVFTGTLLALMVGQREVALTDAVSEFLPSSVMPSWKGNRIRLVDLATHTSGLPRLPMNQPMADPGNPLADYTVAQLYSFLSDYTLTRGIGAEYEYPTRWRARRSRLAHPTSLLPRPFLDQWRDRGSRSFIGLDPPRRAAVVLSKYLGVYELGPDQTITVTASPNGLIGQATGIGRAPLHPQSETEFIIQPINARVTFEQDTAGTVIGLTLHYANRDNHAKKTA